MSFVQLAVLDTQSNQTLAERLIDQLANRIGGLGVELADIAGNVQEVASRVANQSERFHRLQKTAETMVSANRDIANASQAVQSTTSTAVVEIVQSRGAVDTAGEDNPRPVPAGRPPPNPPPPPRPRPRPGAQSFRARPGDAPADH